MTFLPRCCFAVLLCVLFAVPAQPVSQAPARKPVIVAHGERQHTVSGIVLSSGHHRFVLLAATELATALFPGESASVRIRSVGTTMREPGFIYLGKAATDAGLIAAADLAELGQGGYVVRVADGAVGIGGESPEAVIDGAMAFLKHLGYTFYYRYEPPIVPEVEQIHVSPYTESRTPAFHFRAGPYNTRPWQVGFTPLSVIGNPREIGYSRDPFCHTANVLVNYETYHKKHPEYFALGKDGKRLWRRPGKKMPIHLCMSNPEVAEVAAKNLAAWIEKQPDRTYFFVSAGDFSGWCRCENCQKLDAVPMKDTSDRTLAFVNAVARKIRQDYPDKIIMHLAYREATYPPSREGLEDNVRVMFCLYPPFFNSQSTFRSPANRRGTAALDGWLAKFPGKVYMYEYPRSYATNLEVFGSLYACAEKIKFFARHKVPGIYYCSTANDCQALWEHVMLSLMWQPEADVESLIDDFLPVFYGAAAPHMRQYHDLVYSEIKRRGIEQYCETRNRGLVTPEFAKKAYAILAAADRAVQDKPLLRKRIGPEKRRILFCDLDERNLFNGRAEKGLELYAGKLAEFVSLVRPYRLPYFERTYKSHAWFKRTAGLEVGKPWYEDKLLDQLVAEPLPVLRKHSSFLNGYSFTQESLPNGWRIPLSSVLGAMGPRYYDYKCPGRQAVWIQRSSSPFNRLRTVLELKEDEVGPLVMVADCQIASLKPRIHIRFNGKTVFRGKGTGAVCNWREVRFEIPANVLKVGRNLFEIENETPSGEVDGTHFGGWYMLDKLEFHRP